MPKRDLTLDDIKAVMALQAEKPERETYKAVERLAFETCGWRLLTILKYVEKDQVVERVSSSDEKAYPLGGRKDQFLSVLIGRPLAVVQISLQLELNGDPVYNQLWDTTVEPHAPHNLLRDIGDVDTVPFPVRLGSLELRNDGVIGYLLPAENNTTFYAVHYPDEMSENDTFVRQIVQNGQYQGNISLQCQGPSVTATLIIDPRGSVHAYTGILPVLSAQLPPQAVETFMRQLQVTFRTGPIIADPGTLRIPQPAENHGTWSWIQRVGPPKNWETDAIVDADDQARLPDGSLQLREGWLQLSDIDEEGPS